MNVTPAQTAAIARNVGPWTWGLGTAGLAAGAAWGGRHYGPTGVFLGGLAGWTVLGGVGALIDSR